jgi:hypothetical protein
MSKYLLAFLGIIISAVVSLGINAATDPALHAKPELKTKAEPEIKEPHQTGERYLPSDQQMLDIDNTLSKAKEANKLALIVMGANWCHDSRALATKLFLPEVKDTIESNYELLFVDVGYLTKVKKVITRFGMPVIYATPTVLIIEPNSEQQINGHNMHLWRDADKVSVSDTIEYFSDIANNRHDLLVSLTKVKTENLALLDALNQSINQFEQHQAQRIYKAFTIIGPLLKEKKEGGQAKNFAKHWKAVAALRYKITDDLAILRQQAIEIASVTNSEKKLSFPEYPAFVWELKEQVNNQEHGS